MNWKHKIKTYISEQLRVDDGAKLLIAVSGGKDSVVLLYVLHELGYQIAVAHVNFGLRGEESNMDALFVHNLAKIFGLKFHLKSVDTKTYAKRNALSTQEAARELRYQWFEKIREQEGYDYIAVAHHKNDVLETQLINLMRGTGLRGLRSIKPINHKVVRPLLCLNTQELTAILKEAELDYREDSSNASDVYLRNKIRHYVIPEMQACREDVIEQASLSASLLRGTEDLLDALMAEKREGLIKQVGPKILGFHIVDLEGKSEAFLYELFRPYGQVNLKDLQHLFIAETGKKIENNEYVFLKNRDQLLIKRQQHQSNPIELIEEGQWLLHDPLSIEIQELDGLPNNFDLKSKYQCVVPASSLSFPLKIRKWVEGDKMTPYGMKGSKLISDILTDLKLSRFEKEEVYVLCSDNKVVWLIGYRTSNDFKVVDKNEKLYLFTLNTISK